MGCTEPIAVAYAAAVARDTLGRMPEKTELIVSGNIVKNVKSVVVPNTGGRKGLRTAVAAGLCFGKAEKELEVISAATEDDLKELDAYLETADIAMKEADSEHPFDLAVRLLAGEDSSYVHIVAHTPTSCASRKTTRSCWTSPSATKPSRLRRTGSC